MGFKHIRFAKCGVFKLKFTPVGADSISARIPTRAGIFIRRNRENGQTKSFPSGEGGPQRGGYAERVRWMRRSLYNISNL